MLNYKKIIVGEGRRAFLYFDQQLSRILMPGTYRFVNFLRRAEAEFFDISQPLFEHRLKRFLLTQHAEEAQKHFYSFETGDYQVGLCFAGEKLFDIIPPGTHRMYWRGVVDVRVELIDISQDFEIPADRHGILAQMQKLPGGQAVDNAILSFEVEENHCALLTVDGKRVKVLGSGRYAFWRFNRLIKVFRVDLRLQSVDVSGQEILTKDKLSLRINLSANFRVADAELMQSSLSDYSAYLYKELQFALREAVGTKTLDELLENK